MSNIISIHGYDIHYQNGEPTIQDLDLAKRLGYENTYNIRTLIKKMLERGQLKDGQVFCVAQKTSDQGGRPGVAYYLGEFASLKVTTQAGTAKSDEITDEIINVFIDARKGVKPADHANQYPFDIEFQVAEVAARMLRMSDTSKVRMLANICELKGVSSAFLPAYVDEDLTRALTQLLKDQGSQLSAKAANLAMIDMGLLAEMERKGSKGDTKRFKSLTEAGLKYGRNETSPQNPRETQPLYYVAKFPELLDLINAHLSKDEAA